ncbi:MAG TPA: hypothetical protein VMW01_16495 [Williamwhitmania sp.]|nr:hypothetical protein [Williamwhitmania sp.]
MPYYRIEHPTGTSFVSTGESTSLEVKRVNETVSIAHNPYPFTHKPEGCDLMLIDEREFVHQFDSALYDITHRK